MQRLEALQAIYSRLEHHVVVTIMGAVAAELQSIGHRPNSRYRPRNLLHIVFDNESLLSVGGFPTATSTGSDLAALAAAAGVPRTTTVRTLDDFTRACDEALAAGDLTTVVAKVDAVGPSRYVTDLALLENRFQSQRDLRGGLTPLG
jgi:sulfopyruvate decarboxylase subunit beta